MDGETLDKGEIVPEDVSSRDLRDEANLRAFRAGYAVTKDGRRQPRKIQSLNPWGKRKLNIWPRDDAGRLIE